MPTTWTSHFAERVNNVKPSSVREILKFTQRPEVISFAGGLPAPELFPLDRFAEACARVLRTDGTKALQYSTTEGYPALREWVVQFMRRSDPNFPFTADNVLITASSQQALDLVGKLLVDSTHPVLVESPSYLGAFQAFSLFNPQYITAPTDEDGLQTKALEPLLRTQPNFMYLMPNFQNPGGITLSLERRHELVRLAEHYSVPIVEDDPYGQLRFEGDSLPTVLACDQTVNLAKGQGVGTGNVIYMSTFSKILAPGLRLGWVIAPAEPLQKLVQIKQGADLHTSTFAQMVMYEAAKEGFVEQHILHLREVYRERRDVMLEALEEFFPNEVQWTHPKGGLFLWVTLPAGMNSMELLEVAVQKNVAFVPGDGFFPNPADGLRHLRLNFSNAQPDMIREGIHRLSVAIKEKLFTHQRGTQFRAK
jgi:2-aminoadipate transaminase